MKDIKKSASLKSKVRGKETQFKIDLDYSPEYDSFNIKVKKGEGFMSYTDALQGLPLDVVQNINEMLEEILIKAGSETEMKEYDNDYADIGQFSLSDSEGKKTEQEYIDLGKKIVKTKFNGDIGKAYDSVVRNKREFGGDFQAGVYASGGGIPNNYEGKSADEVWKDWSYDQKYHFLSDHREKIGFEEDLYNESKRTTKPKKSSMGTEIGFMYIDIDKIINTKYIELPRYVKFALLDHVRSGQYNKGGAVTNERKHVNKDENYEVRYAKPRPSRTGYKGLRSFEHGGGIGMEEDIDLTDDNVMRVRKPAMPNKKLSSQELAEKHNASAYEYMTEDKMATGGALVGNQKRIDLNKNGKIDAEDFKLLRSSMNGAWRNDHKHVNHDEDYEVRYAKPRPHRKGYKGKRKFGEGGGISNFERLSRVVAKNYEGKRVKPQYQKEYGKTYSKSEAKEVGNKVAGKVKANQKMATGGKTNRGGIMVLAKKIRKDGESWKDALKRAGQQQK